MNNNRAEGSIELFIVGRKYWLFANAPRGARASAIIYNFVELAKENRLKPCAYRTHLFEKPPNLDSRDANVLDLLLPRNVNLQSDPAN